MVSSLQPDLTDAVVGQAVLLAEARALLGLRPATEEPGLRLSPHPGPGTRIIKHFLFLVIHSGDRM